jgi:hypothetical protein
VLTCKQVDFDHDSRKDWVVGYTPKGSPAFEKADFDYDGKFDMSALYDPKTGKRSRSSATATSTASTTSRKSTIASRP